MSKTLGTDYLVNVETANKETMRVDLYSWLSYTQLYDKLYNARVKLKGDAKTTIFIVKGKGKEDGKYQPIIKGIQKEVMTFFKAQYKENPIPTPKTIVELNVTLPVLSIKAFKTFKGHDGIGFNCTLWDGNKKIADVQDMADGGEVRIRFTDRKKEKSYWGFAKELCEASKMTPYYFPYEKDGESYFESYILYLTYEYEWKKKCKNKTLFVLKNEDIRMANVPYGPQIKKEIEDQFKGDLVEILNERFL